MATEVLRPHDVLRGPFPTVLQPHRRRANANPRAYRKPTAPALAPRPEGGRRAQRERSPRTASGGGDGGQVAVFRRGERIRRPEEVYAGSGFCNSPAPSALPLPSSLVVKRGDDAAQAAATMTLRRILGLH